MLIVVYVINYLCVVYFVFLCMVISEIIPKRLSRLRYSLYAFNVFFLVYITILSNLLLFVIDF